MKDLIKEREELTAIQQQLVRLADGALTIEQDSPLPADGILPETRGNIVFGIAHPSPMRATYTLSKTEGAPAL